MQMKNIPKINKFLKKGGTQMSRLSGEIKDKIKEAYFSQGKNQKQIAEEFNVKQGTVSKIVNADSRITNFKKKKHEQSLENAKAYQKEYWETYNRPKKSNTDREEYEKLQAQHAKDVYKLSTQPGYISDYDFAKWNLGVYHTNKNGNLVLNKELKVRYDVPKSINMNIKVPTQKYKNKYCYSR